MRREYYLGAAGPRPRGVAEFTISVAEFTKIFTCRPKTLAISENYCIFVPETINNNDYGNKDDTSTRYSAAVGKH